MKKQTGFTLIELIAVIVILAILAAVALPKFVSISGEARIAKMQGAVGAMNSSGVMIHAKFLAAGSPSSGTIDFEGGNLSVAGDIVNGYPSAGRIALVAGLSANDFSAGTIAGGALPVSEPGKPACVVTYTEAAAGAAPVLNATALTLANCQ